MNCFWERAATKQNFKKLKELVEYHWNVEARKENFGKNWWKKLSHKNGIGRHSRKRNSVDNIVRYTEDKNENKANNVCGWIYECSEGLKRKWLIQKAQKFQKWHKWSFQIRKADNVTKQIFKAIIHWGPNIDFAISIKRAYLCTRKNFPEMVSMKVYYWI